MEACVARRDDDDGPHLHIRRYLCWTDSQTRSRYDFLLIFLNFFKSLFLFG